MLLLKPFVAEDFPFPFCKFAKQIIDFRISFSCCGNSKVMLFLCLLHFVEYQMRIKLSSSMSGLCKANTKRINTKMKL